MSERSLLAVEAHPDDESIGVGGTLARYAAEGVRTTLVTAALFACGFGAAFGTIPFTPQMVPGLFPKVQPLMGKIRRRLDLGWEPSGRPSCGKHAGS